MMILALGMAVVTARDGSRQCIAGATPRKLLRTYLFRCKDPPWIGLGHCRSCSGDPHPDRSRSGEWLDQLDREDQKRIGRDIAKVQYGWPIGLPICRPLGSGLWEVRSSLPSRREARVFFGFDEDVLVALHALFKKSRAAPAADLALARRRLKEMLDG